MVLNAICLTKIGALQHHATTQRQTIREDGRSALWSKMLSDLQHTTGTLLPLNAAPNHNSSIL